MPQRSCLLVLDYLHVWRYDARNGAFIDAFVPQGPEFWFKASMAIGPDGNLYVAVPDFTREVLKANSGVARYRASNGTLLDVFARVDRVMDHKAIAFGPDGNLYVGAYRHPQYLEPAWDPQIWRFNGTTGALIDSFVPIGSGGLTGAVDLAFGPDGHLYVATPAGWERGRGQNILRYDGTSGAFLGEFVPARLGGLTQPAGLTFGPDGNLYVSDLVNDRVLRYNGATGAFIDNFVSNATGELKEPRGLAFGPDGHLYVCGLTGVVRYGGTTGALIDVFVRKSFASYEALDLLFATMEVRLPPLPLLWRRVPRWLQVITLISVGIVIGFAAGTRRRVPVPRQTAGG